ncbi:MAG: phytanoyl-CoA dioxygenase family protein [Candidatus Sumerlaeaceae bacterium]
MLTTTTTLDPAGPEFYREHGYWLHRKPVFSAEKFERLRALFEEIAATRGAKRMDELDTPHFAEPRLFEFLLADEVLDVVQPIIGPNIGLWSSHFICKEPRTGRATPWHTDADYWKGRFDRFDAIVTMWLALDPSDKENGCMKVIPGTHKGEGFEYSAVDANRNLFDKEISGQTFSDADAVYFELQPDECSLHDSRIAHGAEANTSPRRRCGYTMRYFDLGMKVTGGPINEGFKVWHARGENVGGNPLEYL